MASDVNQELQISNLMVPIEGLVNEGDQAEYGVVQQPAYAVSASQSRLFDEHSNLSTGLGYQGKRSQKPDRLIANGRLPMTHPARLKYERDRFAAKQALREKQRAELEKAKED